MLESDPLGCRPRYQWARADGVESADSAVALVDRGAPPDLDDAALAVFLRLGSFVGDDTPFAAIRAAPVEPIIVPRSPMGYDEAVDGYVMLFRDAVGRRLPDGKRSAVTLSGGRDSRHVLLELVAAGRPPTACVTTRRFTSSDDDIQIAAAIAGALGIDHEVVVPGGSLVAIELRKHRLTSFATPSMAWTVPLADHLAGRFDVVYDGIGGDVLSAGLEDEHRVRLFAEGRLDVLARELLDRRHQDEVLSTILTPEAQQRLSTEVAVERLVPELARFVDAANPLGAFWFWNRNRRELATRPFAVLSSAAEVETPFLDLALVRHLSSLPATMTSTRLGADFHGDAIRRGHPDAPAIPWSRSSPARRAPVANRRLALELAAYAARHPSRLVRRPYVLRHLLPRLLDGRRAHRRDLTALHLLHLEHVAQARSS